jgi:hypothetical protein
MSMSDPGSVELASPTDNLLNAEPATTTAGRGGVGKRGRDAGDILSPTPETIRVRDVLVGQLHVVVALAIVGIVR